MVRYSRFFLRFIASILFLCTVSNVQAQVYINEIDSDSPGIDTEEFVEIRSVAPFTSLAGYVLVFYNGNAASSNANMSYHTIDLSNLTTDMNGIATIGNVAVSPVPDLILSDNIIQNGEDAVALYLAPAINFPDGTIAHDTNLVDALAYDTSDPDAVALMALLNITVQTNENENNLQATESVQRTLTGTYVVKAPTPGAMNDGSGTPYNGLKINVITTNRNEGDSIQIIFTSQTPVATALTFNFSLSSGGFNTSDYTGSTSVTMPSGSSSYTTTINTVDDLLDEGDETLKIKFGTLPTGYNRLNDFIEIRIVDNDYKIDPWGPPTAPTYGIVTPTYPTNYYSSINGLADAALRQALQNIIADSTKVRAHTYGDAYNIIEEADHNPKNGNQVCLMYTEIPRAKYEKQSTGSGTGKWNREHIWPQSRGGFANGTPDLPDGINVFILSNANDILSGHADAHHLRAEDATENSTRNNKDYGQDYNGPLNNKGSWKGDVARALFYMTVRYNGLTLVSGNPNDTTKMQLGDLDSLIKWHSLDPRDDFEMNRNNYIYTWQENRNPFIDLPELVDYLWGTKKGMPFYLTTPIEEMNPIALNIAPNPTKQSIQISGANGIVYLYDIKGQMVASQEIKNGASITIQADNAGLYVVRLISDGNIVTKKVIVE